MKTLTDAQAAQIADLIHHVDLLIDAFNAVEAGEENDQAALQALAALIVARNDISFEEAIEERA